MAGDLQEARAPSPFVHIARGEGRVSIDSLEVIGDVAVRVVLKLVRQAVDAAVNTH
jgi:hypothetical protein